MEVYDMKAKEFIDEIAKGILTEHDILVYCKRLGHEDLKLLVDEIEIETLSYLCSGDVVITDNKDENGNFLFGSYGGNSYTDEVGRLNHACDFICEKYNIDRLPQQTNEEQQPQQKDLHYYCQKAIEKGYLVKAADGYRRTKEWTKAQLAYFLGHFLKPDNTFPDSEYCKMFGESRLGKALSQLADNKNGDGKPRGYEIVNELLQE